MKISHYLTKILFVIYFLVGGLMACSKISISEVILVNGTLEDIKKCSVGIAGKIYSIENMKSGDSAVVNFFVESDDQYKVLVEFVGGRKLEKNIGYVTRGFTYRDTITIHANEIVISATEIN